MKREKLEIAYSILVFVTIPLIVIINTVVLLNVTRKYVLNQELRKKADLVNSVIAQSSLDELKTTDYEAVKSNLQGIETAQPAVRQSRVIVKDAGELKVVAHAKSTNERISDEAKTQISFAIDNKQSNKK